MARADALAFTQRDLDIVAKVYAADVEYFVIAMYIFAAASASP